jgi:putative oxidoreductase
MGVKKMKMKEIGNYGDLLIRIVVGLIFVITGYGKLFGAPGIQGFTGMLTGIGIPAASFIAVLIGVIELIGGVLLILGLWTNYASTLLGIIIFVAILAVHLKNGWGDTRYPLLLLVALIRYMGTSGYCDVKTCFK